MTVSIIIVTFNTKDLVLECLRSLKRSEDSLKKAGYSIEVIISDNGSDDTVAAVNKEFPQIRTFQNGNIGFGRANNKAREFCKGKYVLMLNPDTQVKEGSLVKAIEYMEERVEVGAMTGKIIMPDGTLDRDARRSFPTPYVAITHFSYLDRLFPTSKLFAKYWYGYLPIDKESEIDVLQGAFCLVRKDVLDEVGWYDEDYFLDGEDIDLCWKIKEKGYKIMYYPSVEILHHKGATKGKGSAKVDPSVRRKSISEGANAMGIFYRKHLWSKYPLPLNLSVVAGMKVLKMLRLFQFELKRKLKAS